MAQDGNKITGRVGAIAGIDIRVHWSFGLLIAWILLSHAMQNHGIGVALEGVVLILALFGCVILHELGHALTARRFGIRTRDITLYPIGGVARLERIPERPSEELRVALAGPAVNVVIALGLFGVLLSLGALPEAGALQQAGGNFIAKLMGLNIMLGVFNLIPAFPMDGGRVLRALLAMRMEYVQATQYAAMAGQAIAIGFGVLGLFINPFLLFIALFVFVGAQQEAVMAQARSVLAGVPVSAAMVTRYATLDVNQRVLAAASEHIRLGQQDFPVMDQGHLVGLLPRRVLLQALAGGSQEARLSDVMVPTTSGVQETEMLDAAFERMQEMRCPLLPVMRGDRLVGLLTMENVSEWLMVQSSLRGSTANPRVESHGLPRHW